SSPTWKWSWSTEDSRTTATSRPWSSLPEQPVVRIVTDSASDIPAEVARQLQISVVPMYVRFGSEVYRDGVELSPDDFYRKLAASPTIPTTSAPKVKDFNEVYDRLAQETD